MPKLMFIENFYSLMYDALEAAEKADEWLKEAKGFKPTLKIVERDRRTWIDAVAHPRGHVQSIGPFENVNKAQEWIERYGEVEPQVDHFLHDYFDHTKGR